MTITADVTIKLDVNIGGIDPAKVTPDEIREMIIGAAQEKVHLLSVQRMISQGIAQITDCDQPGVIPQEEA